jgi:hypothetical protein
MIRHKIFCNIALTAILWTAPTSLSAQQKMKNADLLDRIDKDFSRFPFDMKEEDAKKLNIPSVTYTESEEGFGTLVDEAGVVHDFYDGLFGKTLTVDPAKPAEPLKLLRLGLARKQANVLFAFRKYSSGRALKCHKPIPSAGEDPAHADKYAYFCEFHFDPDGARLVVNFNKDRYLTQIRVMAWDPF